DQVDIANTKKTPRKFKKLPTVDLFCGAGGFSLGAKMAEAMVYTLDVYDFIENNINRKKHKVDVLLAAPPCQGYTMANTRGNIIDMTDNMILALTVPLIVDKLKPKVLVFENVRGFFNKSKSDEMFRMFINDMQDIGYKIETQILKATNFGVKEGIRMPSWPEQTHFTDGVCTEQERANYRLQPTPTVSKAFRGLTNSSPNM
ncbi:5194_t:CDS:2, partial [Gigaspora rosea]